MLLVSENAAQPRVALQAVPALLIPGALGLALGELAEGTALTALLLWAEPLVLALGVYLVLALAFGRRPRVAFGLALGLALMVAGARIQPAFEPHTVEPPSWAQLLRGCALVPEPIRAPVRVMLWTVRPGRPPDASALNLEMEQPDLVVITGTADVGLGRTLQRALGGEALSIPGAAPESDMLIAVRGAFQFCGGEDDHWVLELGSEAGGARAVASFPEIAGAGILPLVALRLSGPGALAEWGGWPERLASAGDGVSGLASALASRQILVVGDVHAPRTFARLGGALRGAGLAAARTPPSWPAALGPLPMLPLHPLDQVWMGPAWASSASRALSAQGQARAPVVVDLLPSSGLAALEGEAGLRSGR